MADNEILTRTSRIRLDAELGIAVLELFEEAEQTLEDAQENLAALVQLGGGTRYPLVVHMARSSTMNRDARICYAGPQGQALYTALALVSRSPVSTMIANMFVSVHASKTTPTKIFTAEEPAIRWLQEIGKV